MKFAKSGMVAAALGILVLVGGCARELKETVWTPVTLEAQTAEIATPEPPAWFKINENHRVFGYGGVNTITGRVALIGNRELVFGKLATTRKAGPHLGYETLFLKTLEDVRTYRIEKSKLLLFDSEGKQLAEFAVGSQPLGEDEK